MQQLIKIVLSSFIICSAIHAGDIEDVKNSIKDSFNYLNKMKKSENDYSKDGALEFSRVVDLCKPLTHQGDLKHMNMSI